MASMSDDLLLSFSIKISLVLFVIGCVTIGCVVGNVAEDI